MLSQRGAARSAGLRNRVQRLQEYAERRAVLCRCSSLPRKRRRLDGPVIVEDADSKIKLKAECSDFKLTASKTITIGFGPAWRATAYVLFRHSREEDWLKLHHSKVTSQPAASEEAFSPRESGEADVEAAVPGRGRKRSHLESCTNLRESESETFDVGSKDADPNTDVGMQAVVPTTTLVSSEPDKVIDHQSHQEPNPPIPLEDQVGVEAHP